MNNPPVRWENIKLRRIAPDVYPRYYRRKIGFAQLVPGHHFFFDLKHTWCEVFYERIDRGFWLLAMEIHVKGNNHYIFEAKKHPSNHFSINLFSGTGRVGYRNLNDIHWADNQAIFSSPGTLSEIYVEKGKVLKCCRLIFTDNYLIGLANSSDGVNNNGRLSVLDKISRVPVFRIPTRAEIFLQDRLFNVLRYERKKHHYKPSVFSILFELTAFFLSSLWIKKLPQMYQ